MHLPDVANRQSVLGGAAPDMTNSLSEKDHSTLVCLEENMWREETRFDVVFMQKALAADFLEYGRSGRTYTREQMLAAPRAAIDATIPLPNLTVRLLGANTAQVTYDSAVMNDGAVEHAHRSSIWSRTAHGWEMRFHHGTPFAAQG